MIRKVVFIAHDNYGSREIFTKLFTDHQDVTFQLIITQGLYYRKSFLESIFKMLKEASFWFCFYRSIELLIYKIKGDSLESRARQFGVNIYKTHDVNGAKANNFIRSVEPDVILSTFTMHILKKNTIGLPRVATIGCHPSILPEYRGLETFFWVLANDEKKSGVSVFYVAEKIDAGEVIMQEPFDVAADETVESIYHKLTVICARLLSDTLSILKNNGQFNRYPQVGKGSYFPMPTKEAYKRFKKSGKKWK
jgi:methionyl-tRNA formyltransferase